MLKTSLRDTLAWARDDTSPRKFGIWVIWIVAGAGNIILAVKWATVYFNVWVWYPTIPNIGDVTLQIFVGLLTIYGGLRLARDQ